MGEASLATTPQLIYDIHPELFGIIKGGFTVYSYTTLDDVRHSARTPEMPQLQKEILMLRHRDRTSSTALLLNTVSKNM